MIYFGATALAWSAFEGASGGVGPDADEVDVLQSDDPLVLENLVNARGRAQAVDAGRSLMGIQIAGGGKGAQFSVQMLTTRNIPVGLTDMNFTQTDGVQGVRVFIYAAESEAELNIRKQDALARARAFVTAFTLPEWRGCEIGGGNDGRVFMGMFVVKRGPAV